jgi:hypothetical protein
VLARAMVYCNVQRDGRGGHVIDTWTARAIVIGSSRHSRLGTVLSISGVPRFTSVLRGLGRGSVTPARHYLSPRELHAVGMQPMHERRVLMFVVKTRPDGARR